jgi:opacity protein-like surface antigen
MKHGLVLVVALIIVLCAAGAFAAQPLGGPPEAGPGKWAISGGYFYSQDKWTSNTISGNFDPKVSTYSYFGQLAFGVAQGWDLYLRAGAVDAKLAQSDVDFKSDGNFFAALGTHGTLFEKKPWHLALGPIANVAYYSNWTDRRPSALFAATGTGLTSITIRDHWSANVGLGFRWTPIQFLTIYGGPFYNYESAKLQSNGYFRGIPFSGSGNNISGDKSFGSRLGVRIPVTNQFSINLEAQMKDYLGAGGWLTYSF